MSPYGASISWFERGHRHSQDQQSVSRCRSPSTNQFVGLIVGTRKNRHKAPIFLRAVAEGEGFEPSIRFPAYTLSKRAPSATRPPLRRSFSDGRETSGADRRRQGGLIIPLQIGHSCATLRLVNHFRRRYGDASVIYHRLDSVNRRLRGGRCGDHCARAPRGHRMDAVGARVVAGAVAGLVSSGRSPAQRHTSLVVGSRHALAFDAAGVVFDGGARRDPCVDLPAEP